MSNYHTLEQFKYCWQVCLIAKLHLLPGAHDGAGADPALPDRGARGCRLVRGQSQGRGGGVRR